MYILSIEEWISAVFVKSLGWAFVHSLWQSLLALLAAYTVLAAMKKAKPALRYNLLLFISVLFIISFVTTLILQLKLHSAVPADKINGTDLKNLFPDRNNVAAPVIYGSKKIIDAITESFNSYLHFFVAAWFIIFCIKWLRLTLSLNYVNRISRYESTSVSPQWQSILLALQNKIGVSGSVTLLQSNIVKVPLVTGLIKPIILVPAAMFSNMSPDLIESILLHELAHIRRRDYLVNIIQSSVETIFFFNPFIIKLSNLIKEEREASCDEIAIGTTQNKISYVEALVAFGEFSIDHSPALAFTGSKNLLLQRVKRILYNQNKKPGIMEKSILLCSVITMFIITAFTTVNNAKKSQIPVFHQVQSTIKDTVPDETAAPAEIKKTEKRKKRVRDEEEKIEKEQEEVEMTENNVELDHEQFNQQQLQKTIQEQNVKIQKLLQELQLQKTVDVDKINQEVRLALQKTQHVFNKDLYVNIRENMQMQKAVFDSLKMKLNLNVNTAINLHRNISSFSAPYEILDFIEKNKIADQSDVKSFSLNENEFIVNGKKQSSSLHQQLKEKYIGRKDDYVNYSNTGGNKSISIQHNDPK